MNRYNRLLLVAAITAIAALLLWKVAYGGGYFAGSH